jgi:CBS domain-containing protein
MESFKKHILFSDYKIKDALYELDILAEDAILFIIDKSERLIGSLTDGDIRRGLLNGLTIEDSVNSVMESGLS